MRRERLNFRIATIGTVCVGFDEFPDSEPIGGFGGGYCVVNGPDRNKKRS